MQKICTFCMTILNYWYGTSENWQIVWGISFHTNASTSVTATNGTSVSFLTLWELGYNIFVLRFRPKTSSCQLPYQCPSSTADCARELFTGSNGSDSLLDCTRKKFFGWGLQIFCGEVKSEVFCRAKWTLPFHNVLWSTTLHLGFFQW